MVSCLWDLHLFMDDHLRKDVQDLNTEKTSNPDLPPGHAKGTHIRS